MSKYVKFEQISLKSDPTLTEKWVQDRIAEDPSILGLGDLVLKDKERSQPRAGRLDLLLQHADSGQRYEVEVQLGSTDETHIIRTIEYWDIERRRYPQYEHTAVIVAETITARFLNVISLFNGTIPLVAIQMSALRVGEQVGLVFTKVLDHMPRGLVDEDEETTELTDRAYWESRSTPRTMAMVDELLLLVRSLSPQLAKVELKYNKFYIGLARDGEPCNFVVFRPKKNFLRLEPRLDQSEDRTDSLEKAGLDVMGYDDRWSRYRIRLTSEAMKTHATILAKLLGDASKEIVS